MILSFTTHLFRITIHKKNKIYRFDLPNFILAFGSIPLIDKNCQRWKDTHRQPFKVMKLVLPTSDGLLFLFQDEISYIKSENIYSYVYNGTQEVFTTYSLKQYEGILDTSIFYRCHRSFIVNLNKIQKITKAHNCLVLLKNGAEIPVSRNKKKELIKILLKANDSTY